MYISLFFYFTRIFTADFFIHAYIGIQIKYRKKYIQVLHFSFDWIFRFFKPYCVNYIHVVM